MPGTLRPDYCKSVCHDVEIEPLLQPVINKQGCKASAILGDYDRSVDVQATEFWGDGHNAYFDVRMTNADSISQRDSTIKSLLQKHEQEEKQQYNKHIIQVEDGTLEKDSIINNMRTIYLHLKICTLFTPASTSTTASATTITTKISIIDHRHSSVHPFPTDCMPNVLL